MGIGKVSIKSIVCGGMKKRGEKIGMHEPEKHFSLEMMFFYVHIMEKKCNMGLGFWCVCCANINVWYDAFAYTMWKAVYGAFYQTV